MKSQFISRRDLEFLLYEWLEQQQICQHPRFELHNRETFDAALDICERIASDLFAAPSTNQDEAGLKQLKLAFDTIAETGMLAASQDFASGGMQLPHAIELAGHSYFLAGNSHYAMYALLSMLSARLVLRLGSEAAIQTWGRPLLNGQILGSFAFSESLTEANLAGIQARAYLQADGSYRLLGQKTWVLGGNAEVCANTLHFVLARIVDAQGQVIAGSAGISLFMVPQLIETAAGVQANNLLCEPEVMHASVPAGMYCRMQLGHADPATGALAYLLGNPHRGLAHILPVINEIRLMLGLCCSALASQSYHQTLSHLRAQQASIDLHAKSGLLAAKAYSEGAMALCIYCASLSDQEKYASQHEHRQQARLLLEILLPVAKAWPAYAAQRVAEYCRDLTGLSAFSGTAALVRLTGQIQLSAVQQGGLHVQAQDLVLRKLFAEDGQALELLGGRIHKTLNQASRITELAGYAKELARIMQKLALVTQQFNQSQDQQRALCVAPAYLDCFGDTVIAWLWLEQALHCNDKLMSAEAEFYHGKMQACRYFYRWELIRVHGKLDPLLSLDNSIYEMQAEWF